MLNGRCKSDAAGLPTYNYTKPDGQVGYSNVDYAFTSCNNSVYDLQIEEGFNNTVGHAALVVSMQT